MTDGTEAGTALVRDINPGPAASEPIFTFRNTIDGQIDGRVLFSADDGTLGRELWITDGTEAGTRLLKDINTGGAGSFPNQFVTLAGARVVFSADDGIHGRELWVSDGTEPGTRLLVDTVPGMQGGAPRDLTPLERDHIR
ncbi:MAG: hypothetical protein JJU19_09825 [Pararhodobacter sp.]|nr:hypothetical protein [Pararhodobacter sp.]